MADFLVATLAAVRQSHYLRGFRFGDLFSLEVTFVIRGNGINVHVLPGGICRSVKPTITYHIFLNSVV